MASVNSTLYKQLEVDKYLSKGTDRGGQSVIIPIAHTVVTGEANGDTANLATVPANSRVIDFDLNTDGLGTSVTGIVGDAGDTDRLMVSTALAASGNTGRLAFTGAHWIPTADTIIYLTYGGANPTAGKIVRGFIEVILP